MRIISGFLKGRKLDGFDIVGTRPTMDRVKESLFGSIQLYIKNAVCLDLFAGSGSLGLEAISNGASKCYFVDNNIKITTLLTKTVHDFNIQDQSEILNKDYKNAINYFKDNNIAFDIIFIDPPYKKNIVEDAVQVIVQNNILNKKGIIVCETEINFKLQDLPTLELIKFKKYGDKQINVYQRK